MSIKVFGLSLAGSINFNFKLYAKKRHLSTSETLRC